MTVKKILAFLFSVSLVFSCAEDNDVFVPRNLQEYIDISSNGDLGNVIACAANASGNTSLTYVFFYPEEGATEVRYYEADSLNVDPTVFANYKRQNLSLENVFNGHLQRFVRSGASENWGLVTYFKDGKLHKSNPIRLKNATSQTTWTDQVTINYETTLEPQFSWSDVNVADSDIYFQVVSDEEENFLSGTYTRDKFFKYYDESNVDPNLLIHTETPPALIADKEYSFTMMAVNEETGWVNTVIQEKFIPKNLQEYLDEQNDKTIETTFAFGASNSENENLSYIYYYPLIGATELRYYETADAKVDDENDFSNYHRRNLTDEAVFGGKMRRYSRTSATERWSIVTYIIADKLYKSEPIRIKNKDRTTEWISEVPIDFSEFLKPRFTWEDGKFQENEKYFQVFTDASNNFLSGTFTTEKMIQYGSFDNLENINLETPPSLVVENTYKFTLFGLSSDNWANLVIQKSFEVE